MNADTEGWRRAIASSRASSAAWRTPPVKYRLRLVLSVWFAAASIIASIGGITSGSDAALRLMMLLPVGSAFWIGDYVGGDPSTYVACSWLLFLTLTLATLAASRGTRFWLLFTTLSLLLAASTLSWFVFLRNFGVM